MSMHTLTEDASTPRRPHAWRWSLPAAGLALIGLCLAITANPAACADPTTLSQAAFDVAAFALAVSGITAFGQLIAVAALPGSRRSALGGLGLAGLAALLAIWAMFTASPICLNFDF